MSDEHFHDHFVAIKKTDLVKQLVFGEVYIPNMLDSQGDFMTAEPIEKMAHDFMRNLLLSKVDVEHNLKESGAHVVESFIARPGDPDFVPGSWVLGVHVPDPSLWERVTKGDINGFSMYGSGQRQERVLEVDIPDDGILKGEVERGGLLQEHTHSFQLHFDNDGSFRGGETAMMKGDGTSAHTHLIKRGTITEPAGEDKHVHRYSFLATGEPK
jgi:hypothetical protein